MNVEIGAEAALFPEKEYINGIAFAVRWTQSRQSAKLFLQSSELGLPQPLTRRRVFSPPPPRFWGERGTLAGERGVGKVPIPTRGHTLCAAEPRNGD
jgi:hypothetical protein